MEHSMELWVNEFWLFTAYVVGSAAGLFIGLRIGSKRVIEDTIDSLIAEKYLKTRSVGTGMEILKYTEWCDDQTTGKTT